MLVRSLAVALFGALVFLASYFVGAVIASSPDESHPSREISALPSDADFVELVNPDASGGLVFE